MESLADGDSHSANDTGDEGLSRGPLEVSKITLLSVACATAPAWCAPEL